MEVLALAFAPLSARAEGDLDPGTLTFRDFATRDRGSSFDKVDPMIGAGAQPTQSQVLTIDNKGGFASAHWDGTGETEEKIKELTKATIRCIPFDAKQEAGACILTGKPSTQRVLFAKAY